MLHRIDLTSDAPRPIQGGRLTQIPHFSIGGIVQWDPDKFTLYRPPILRYVSGVKGTTIEARAKKWATAQGTKLANANLLDYWLLFPEIIPSECEGKCVCFFGTHYVEHKKQMYVRCLWCHDGIREEIDTLLAGHGFSGDCYVALYG